MAPLDSQDYGGETNSADDAGTGEEFSGTDGDHPLYAQTEPVRLVARRMVRFQIDRISTGGV